METNHRGGELYIRLLRLGEQEELGPFLRAALGLIVEVTGARQGYLELYPDGADANDVDWRFAHGFSDEEIHAIRAKISSGIIAQAIATGRVLMTPAAYLDPRFRERQSVLSSRIEAVLCAPIGRGAPMGVLYLHGEHEFSREQIADLEIFARHLAPFADRLIARQVQQDHGDLTRGPRAALRLAGVVGRSAALAAVFRQVALVAPLEINVLITGESGTGKSQLARVIHDNSPRAAGPFVEINCGALPETLIESELFGALPGAHSTATRRIDGKVTAAEHGTLFLDEITELPTESQAKLLQLLQSRIYYPLGGTKPVAANVRVIAATNMDVQAAIASRRFREDLYYRLEVLPIRMPTLAERREDIPELARRFIADTCLRHRLPTVTLSPSAIQSLQTADWPGHVRQLAHMIEAAVIRTNGDGAERIEPGHLFPHLSRGTGAAATSVSFQEATRRFQADLLRKNLEESDWSIPETARRLDLSRSSVYKLINVFGFDRPA